MQNSNFKSMIKIKNYFQVKRYPSSRAPKENKFPMGYTPFTTGRSTLHATRSRGSAVVAVMAVLAVAIVILTVMTQRVIVQSMMSLDFKKSNEAYDNAIAGIEEANLRLLRDSTFTTETLSFTDGNAIINVTGSNPKTVTIISRVNSNKYICQIQATATYDASGNLSLSNITEIYD